MKTDKQIAEENIKVLNCITYLVHKKILDAGEFIPQWTARCNIHLKKVREEEESWIFALGKDKRGFLELREIINQYSEAGIK